MKKLFSLLVTITILTGLGSCNKETATTQTEVMNSMLTNKNWYLDYSITGTNAKAFIGSRNKMYFN